MLRSRLAVLAAFAVFTTAAHADCTKLYDMKADKVLFSQGDCSTRHSPASTFKIPLALMGFDSKILVDEHNPKLPYKEEYDAVMPSHKHDTDPTYWEKESVVWYSQQMTQKLGMEKFQHYVELFNYGNKDLSGDDALTHAWLGDTLQISPDEQIEFLKNVLTRKYKVSSHAYTMLDNILPTFPSDNGWTIHGKTGSASGEDHRQFGWFVGWATKADHQVVFVRYALDKDDIDSPAGPRNREEMLKKFPVLLPSN